MVEAISSVTNMEMLTVTVLLVSAGVAAYGFWALKNEEKILKNILEE